MSEDRNRSIFVERKGPLEEEVDKLVRQFDGTLKRSAQIFLALLFTALLFFLLIGIACVMQLFYGVAASVALALILFVALFSYFFYAQDFFEEELMRVESALCLFFETHQQEGSPQAIAEEYVRLGVWLKRREPCFFPKRMARRDSFFFREWLWIPYLFLSEAFFHASIFCYVRLIREEPKDPTLHAGLANTYVTISTYMKEAIAMKETLLLKGLFVPRSLFAGLEKKHAYVAMRAIEELCILRALEPCELWILDQLSMSYRERGMVNEETEVYREILRLSPDDTNALFRLGVIFFRRGKNAEGLELYDHLLRIEPLLAHEMISFFGAYDIASFSPISQKVCGGT